MSTLNTTAKVTYKPFSSFGLLNIIGWYLWTIVVAIIISASIGVAAWMWSINSLPSTTNGDLLIMKLVVTAAAIVNIVIWTIHIHNFWESERD